MEPVRRHRIQIDWHLQPVDLMIKVTKPCCMSQRAYRDLIALSCQGLKHTQIIWYIWEGTDNTHCLLRICQYLQHHHSAVGTRVLVASMAMYVWYF